MLAEQYNRQASEFIFRANNAQQADDTIDLHGLYAEEAEQILQTRIDTARRSGAKGLHVYGPTVILRSFLASRLTFAAIGETTASPWP